MLVGIWDSATLTRFVTHIATPSTPATKNAEKTFETQGVAELVPQVRYSKLARAGKWLIGTWLSTTTPMHARATCRASTDKLLLIDGKPASLMA